MEGSYYENHRQEIYRRLFLDGGSFLSYENFVSFLFLGRNMFSFLFFFLGGGCLCWNFFPRLFLIGAFRSCNYSLPTPLNPLPRFGTDSLLLVCAGHLKISNIFFFLIKWEIFLFFFFLILNGGNR